MSVERRCMIIDDQPVLRLGIRRLLESSYEVEELGDGRGAVELLTSVGGFEVAIVEMRAKSGGAPSGPSTIRALLRAQPGLGVVAYGGRIERHAMREALEAGASAYVSKRSAPSALVDAVSAATELEAFVDPSATRAARSTRLTRRQREILQLFADGHSTGETARLLGVSAETVRTHAKGSLSRLEARDRAHAIAIALRGSLID